MFYTYHMIQPFLVFGDWGIFVLRVVLGLILVVHGWPKIKDIKNTAGWMGQTFKPGILWAAVVSLAEFIGGLLLILGLLTQLIALIVAVEFLIILFVMKRWKGFVGGYEFDFIILASALALLTLSGGHLSLDSFFGILIY
ncbi:DoxX family protein [bacterium]|nr:MAG: DoxX family protein [bacterium]